MVENIKKLKNKLYNKNYREKHREKLILYSRNFYIKNKEELLKKQKDYYIRNKEWIRVKSKKNREKNKEYIKIYQKEYRKTHKNESSAYKKEYLIKYPGRKAEGDRLYEKRKSKDPLFCLPKRLRHRLRVALKNNQKTGSAVEDLGCSIPELKIHIEKQFTEGMNWDNWGNKGWHIDHIVPLSSFDLTNREQLLRAVNFTNLQPMWWFENLKKGKKL